MKSHAGRAYVTYFDKQFAARGLSMMQSLLHYDSHAQIVVLALDSLTQKIITNAFSERVRIVTVDELHAFDIRLSGCKDRSPWELYATQKPALIQYAMTSDLFHEVIYVDADLLFFSNPSSFFREVEKASIAVSPHRFTPSTAHLQKYGIFNAGFIYFKNDRHARHCLEDWCNHCLAWCLNKVEDDGRFMNQGYLNQWPSRYTQLKVIEHPGINLAPWNLDGCMLSSQNNKLLVNDEPLICFHFSGLVQNLNEEWYCWYGADKNLQLAKETIYSIYFSKVAEVSRIIYERFKIKGTGTVRELSFQENLILLCSQP